jgi:hypothetical protein
MKVFVNANLNINGNFGHIMGEDIVFDIINLPYFLIDYDEEDKITKEIFNKIDLKNKIAGVFYD